MPRRRSRHETLPELRYPEWTSPGPCGQCGSPPLAFGDRHGRFTVFCGKCGWSKGCLKGTGASIELAVGDWNIRRLPP